MDGFIPGTASMSMKRPDASVLGGAGAVGSVRGISDGGGIEGPASKEKAPSFKDTLTGYFGTVDKLQKTSAEFSQRLAAGENIDLHRVMIAGEQAGVAMSMTIQMRNKIVEAYQEILRMQV